MSVQQLPPSSSWLRLTSEPEQEPDILTKAELAEAVDSLFGVDDHCRGEQGDYDGGDRSDYLRDKLAGDGCEETARQLGVSAGCDAGRRSGASIVKTIRAHCSDDDLRNNYTVKSLGSAIVTSGPSPAEALLRLVIDFSNSASAPIKYLIDRMKLDTLWLEQRYRPRWLGSVLQGKLRVDPPGVLIVGGDVVLTAKVSGRLQLFVPAMWDEWRLSVPGVLLDDGSRRSYKALVAGYSDRLAEPALLEIKDDAEDDPTSGDCGACGGSSVPLGHDGQPTDGSSTVDEEQEQSERDNPAGGVPGKTLGCCGGKGVEYTPVAEADYTGGRKPDQATLDALTEQYGSNLALVGLTPSDGVCGKKITIETAEPCCGGEEPLAIEQDESGEVVAPGNKVGVSWTGGLPPFSVALSGSGFALASDSPTRARSAQVEALAGACGTCVVTITDACNNSASVDIRSTTGIWRFVSTEGSTSLSCGSVVCEQGRYQYTDYICCLSGALNPCTDRPSRSPSCDRSQWPANGYSVQGKTTRIWSCS